MTQMDSEKEDISNKESKNAEFNSPIGKLRKEVMSSTDKLRASLAQSTNLVRILR
jgi:hypothetical protein